MAPYQEQLRQRITSHEASVCIIGMGYVGLPLAVAFAGAGFAVRGIDTDESRVASINRGASHIPDVPDHVLAPLVQGQRLRATTDATVLQTADVAIVCVPTPLRKTREPDISYILAALDQIEQYLHAGELVILESTTYPGTTEEIVLPRFVERGMAIGEDVFLAFSPERVDPGNARFTTQSIPKVVGGVGEVATELAGLLYGQVVDRVVPVSSPKAAEMVKLLENTFRSVNIGLINEFAMMCGRLGVDVWEIIQAASTKPFGFMPFLPGPGLGGHCLPVDPIYLSWKARIHGFEARFIELAAQINSCMPNYVLDRVLLALNDDAKALKGSTVLVLGVTYKRNVNDVRESPALEIITLLADRGADVRYHDPYIPTVRLNDVTYHSSALSKKDLRQVDCAVLVTDHDEVDYEMVTQTVPLIVDTRNKLAGVVPGRARIVKL